MFGRNNQRPNFRSSGASFGSVSHNIHAHQQPGSTLSIQSFHSSDGVAMYDSLNPIKIPKKPKKWTAFKWVLLLTNTVLMCMGIVGMVLSVLTWYKLYIRAAVVLVVSRGTVILITTVSSCAIAVALLGYCGIFFNSRRILTVYSILLWPLMGGLASIGYVTFKFSQWNLEDKLRSNWKHEVYSVDDRMRIQANLHCCGFDLPNDGSEVITNKCHSDTKVKMYGCRYKLFRMVDTYLTNTYITAFSFLVPHVFILFASLLCSNHITENFGTEPAPKLNYHQE